MKKITLIYFCFSGLITFAQPVINSTDLDNLSFSYLRKVASSTTLNQGPAGPNVTWNFSTLIPTLDLDPSDPNDTGVTTITQVATGPFSTSFPSSNYVLKFEEGTSNQNDTYYQYYSKTTPKIEILGGGDSNQIDFSYINPSTFFIFPFSYGTVSTDTSQETADASVSTEIQTYDAYGTLITPFGTFTNVVRIKSENPAFPNDIEYTWYKLNPFRFIMSSYRESPTLVGFDFAEPVVLTTQNFSTSEIKIYPNPANHILNIKISDNAEINKISITDLSGKKVLEQLGNKTNINIESLSNGMYILEVFSMGNKLVHKFVKQ